MKLLDQVFKVYPPADWAEHLPLPMPPLWREATEDIATDEIEVVNWNCGYLMVAKYSAEDAEEPFVSYREASPPTSVRITFKENVPCATKKIFSESFSGRTMPHSCGCCITLFYPGTK
jgi:hypothetical protein